MKRLCGTLPRAVVVLLALLVVGSALFTKRRKNDETDPLNGDPSARDQSSYDFGGTPSLGSVHSVGSLGSARSIGSVGSFWSIGSIGSSFSIGSIGSSFSIGSIGSFGSVASIGSALSIGSFASFGACFSARVAGNTPDKD